jgi:hypothetical protein
MSDKESNAQNSYEELKELLVGPELAQQSELKDDLNS